MMSESLSVEKEYFLEIRWSSFCGEMNTLMTLLFANGCLEKLLKADF